MSKPIAQYWILDTGTCGLSSGTLTASGPHVSQAAAEKWIRDTSASDWMESCGCLRQGEPETWGDAYIIVKEVRRVKPVPPVSVKMILKEVKL